jgi:thiamine biosynthesis protein ThiS
MYPMNLTINGENQISSAETLGALVERLGMKPDRVAIELNREIVPRDQWPQTPLHDGDQLEIVHFVGGGSEHARLSSSPSSAQAHPAPEGRTNLAQRFSAGKSGKNELSPRGTTESSRTQALR